jgi:hypothetical protein
VVYPRVSINAGSNLARICSRAARVTHTCTAFPNSASSVIVSVSKFLSVFDNSQISIDPLAMVYVLKAAGLADMAICKGTSGTPVQFYSIGFYFPLVYSYCSTDVDNSCIDAILQVKPALTGAQATRMMELFGSVAASVVVG